MKRGMSDIVAMAAKIVLPLIVIVMLLYFAAQQMGIKVFPT